MSRNRPNVWPPVVSALLREEDESDPVVAIRTRARGLIALYQERFGAVRPPFDLEILASLRGIPLSEERPRRSPDAELVPTEGGGVEMRVNPDRPTTRRRFSMGHEISHSFLPGYEQKVQCRNPRGGDWADPDDLIESLCDIGSSELLFPLPWFAADASVLSVTGDGVLELARRYEASPEATIRRLVDISAKPCAAVFLVWKLKPLQERKFSGTRGQLCMFDIDPAADASALRGLRVDYCAPSAAFRSRGWFVPEDKSVPNSGVVYEAASENRCVEGEQDLDLGGVKGRLSVRAIPLFTAPEVLGPNGERSVVALIEKPS